MNIALVGNQNCGKTTLFNLLTGSNQKIGNWPGVTIERKEGVINGTDHTVIDLPGVYSLSPYTMEEGVTRQYILDNKPDLIINVVDATSIERGLYLTTQLLELDYPLIVVFNMADIMEKKGVSIDVQKLSAQLGVNVIKISALRGIGINELLDSIANYNKRVGYRKKIYNELVEGVIDNIIAGGAFGKKKMIANKRFIAIKTLEKDPMFINFLNKDIDESIKEIERTYNCKIEELIAGERYQYISYLKTQAVTITDVGISVSDKIDKILLNKYLAIPIFVVIMFLMYFLSVGIVGNATVSFMESIVESLSGFVNALLKSWGASDWSVSLVCDGIIIGVGAVLNFIPQLIILFLCITFLKATGYMSRIAFVFDRLFKKFGLSGKSLIPFIIGSGCSVPGIMATRTIEDQNERTMTIFLTPFFPCSAKLPIIGLFASYFFGTMSGLISASLYFLAVIIIIITASFMKKYIFKEESSTFIFELPEYKLPGFKYVVKDVSDKVLEFMKRAGSIILVCSVIVWFLLSFSWKMEYGIAIENSILASIGNMISWIFYPMIGEMSWEAAVSAIQGLIAKEQVVSSMSIIAGLAETAEEGSGIFNSGVFSFFTPISAYSFMVFNLFSAPCIAAISVMHKEFGDIKKTFRAVLYQTGLAWCLGTLVFLFGNLLSGVFI